MSPRRARDDGNPVTSRRAAPMARRAARVRSDRLAPALILPALLVVLLVVVLPLLWTVWESLHRHDLRMPWLGRPLVGAGNYLAALSDIRLAEALLHTALFIVVSVSLELILGIALALVLDGAFRGRGPVRAMVLLPWAIPTVVTALLWRFMFEAETGLAGALLSATGILAGPPAWFLRPGTAWIPIILADVWKTTPFVALLILAGLQTIDPAVHDAARIDGAGAWRRFTGITLPLLKPAILVALIFRALDAVRVFDLIYVLTGGGPGSATEPIALYTFTTLLQNLRFGYGSALAVILFAATFLLALIPMRLLGGASGEASR